MFNHSWNDIAGNKPAGAAACGVVYLLATPERITGGWMNRLVTCAAQLLGCHITLPVKGCVAIRELESSNDDIFRSMGQISRRRRPVKGCVGK